MHSLVVFHDIVDVIATCCLDPLANQSGCGEVEKRALHRCYGAGRDQVTIQRSVHVTVHSQAMIQNSVLRNRIVSLVIFGQKLICNFTVDYSLMLQGPQPNFGLKNFI